MKLILTLIIIIAIFVSIFSVTLARLKTNFWTYSNRISILFLFVQQITVIDSRRLCNDQERVKRRANSKTAFHLIFRITEFNEKIRQKQENSKMHPEDTIESLNAEILSAERRILYLDSTPGCADWNKTCSTFSHCFLECLSSIIKF